MFFLWIGVNLALKFEKTSMRKISIGLLLFIGFLLGVTINGNAQTAIINVPIVVPSILCLGDNIDFEANSNSGTLTSYQWNWNGGAAGPQTVLGRVVTFNSGNTGTFNMSLTVGDGTNTDVLNFTITINACTPPTIVISGTPTQICAGTQVQFVDNTTVGSQPILTRLWNFPGGAPASSNVANPIVTYTTAGTYDVFFTVTDVNGTYKDTLVGYIEVVNCPTPVAQFVANKTRICPGDCINFTDQSQNMVVGQSNWAWSFPGSDSTVSVQKDPVNICYQIPGVYTVILSATNVTATDTEVKLNYITVDSCLPPIARFGIEKQQICQNTCVRFFNNSLRADSIRWKFFNVDPQYQSSKEPNPVVCYDDTGTFDVQLTAYNPYGGPGILLIQDYISVKPFPTVQAPEDTSVLIGQSVQLRAFGSGRSFIWTPNDGTVDCEFCARVNVSPLENTKYYVTNINGNGCEKTDSVNVIVIKKYYRGVPDAFSPNGDDENDILYVYGNGITNIDMYVYNRQGDIVFESRDQKIGWDGTYKGTKMETGVYVYFVVVTYESGFQEILKGDVTLVR